LTLDTRHPTCDWAAVRMRGVGLGLNLVLRLIVIGVVADALLQPDAARYADKAIGTRGLVLIPASLVILVVHLWQRRRGRGGRYPVWSDNLYLSIFALDMGGNLLDLYDRYPQFDLISHFHGTGAVSVVISHLFRLPVLAGIGVAQVIHILLEAQEYYSDVLFGLRNVRGTWDVVNDLIVGVAGSLTYGALLALARRRGWISRRS
jgi:hypothetical protein